METFIYSDLKKASLKKDESKIPSLGPYAAALSYVIRHANKTRIQKYPYLRNQYTDLLVYRGI